MLAESLYRNGKRKIMRWYSHRIITGVSVFGLTNDLIATIASVVGSTLPDLEEGRGFLSKDLKKYSTWVDRHRKYSHLLLSHFLLFVVFFGLTYSMRKHLILKPKLLLYSLSNFATRPFYALLFYFISFFFLVAFLHVLQDFFFGGIPIYNSNQRIGFKLKTGGNIEYLITILFVLLFGFILKIKYK